MGLDSGNVRGVMRIELRSQVPASREELNNHSVRVMLSETLQRNCEARGQGFKHFDLHADLLRSKGPSLRRGRQLRCAVLELEMRWDLLGFAAAFAARIRRR